MLLTKQQRYVLEVLDRLPCIKISQLTVLINSKFHANFTDDFTQKILRQMQYLNCKLTVIDDVVLRVNSNTEPLVLEAVDVMLELSKGEVLDFKSQVEQGILLKFSTVNSGKKAFFTVISEKHLNNTSLKFSEFEKVIILSSGGETVKNCIIPSKTFLAVRQENDTHKYFELTKN